MFPTGCVNVTSHLMKIKKLQSRVILFSARFVTLLLLFQSLLNSHSNGHDS